MRHARRGATVAMPPALLFVALLLAGNLTAQRYVVSPLSRTNVAGGTTNTIPFWSATHRYQQIHGDLRGTPRVFQGIALRKGGGNQSTAVPRTSTVTMLMCDSSYTNSSVTFVANYAGTPVTVLPATTLNLPDWSQATGAPEPWTLIVPFRFTFPYFATKDLLWEWQIHATSNTGYYSADAYSGTGDDTKDASYVQLGTGCLATGLVKPMTQSTRLFSTTSTGLLSLQLTTSHAPSNSPSSVWLGLTNANASAPGLCEKLYPMPIWSFASISSATGQVLLPLLTTQHDANWAGAKLYLQTLSIDFGQPGLPFAFSQGQEATLPGFGPGVTAIQRIHADDVQATAGTRTLAYGLVTRFAY